MRWAGRGAGRREGARVRSRVSKAEAPAALRPGARLTQRRTMDSRPEEYELNGDVRPGSLGSPDASVSTPTPVALCDLGRCPPSLSPAPAAPRDLWAPTSCAPRP